MKPPPRRARRRADGSSPRPALYIARATRWYAMLGLVVLAALRRLDTARAFEVLTPGALELHFRRRHVTVSIDGEVERLRTPLVYRVRPGALRVLGP